MDYLYKELLTDIGNKGQLSRVQRKRLWKKFEEGFLPGSIQSQEKKIILELNALAKALNVWDEEDVLGIKIKSGIEHIRNFISFPHELNTIIEEICELCDKELKKEDNFYVLYIRQAVNAIGQLVDGEKESDEASAEDEHSLDDGSLEIEELDASYCACVLWEYQDQSASEKTRRYRKQEFWEWYVKEAALMQGAIIEKSVKSRQLYDTENEDIKLDSIKDFVEALSFEFEYLGYEKRNTTKEVKIKVYEQKDGAACPRCGQFSNHINTSFSGIMRLAKLKGWQIILGIKVNRCICDNPQCPEEIFSPRASVDDYALKANYKHIKSIPGNEEKLCKLLGI